MVKELKDEEMPDESKVYVLAARYSDILKRVDDLETDLNRLGKSRRIESAQFQSDLNKLDKSLSSYREMQEKTLNKHLWEYLKLAGTLLLGTIFGKEVIGR